nr:MAG TPA: hypothetical protein [Caudoviricetes sp.]
MATNLDNCTFSKNWCVSLVSFRRCSSLVASIKSKAAVQRNYIIIA